MHVVGRYRLRGEDREERNHDVAVARGRHGSDDEREQDKAENRTEIHQTGFKPTVASLPDSAKSSRDPNEDQNVAHEKEKPRKD